MPSPSSTTNSSTTAVPSSSRESPHQAQTEARAAVLASLESAGSHYDTKFQRRATDLHANATAITKQEAELQKQTSALAKEGAKWQRQLDRATKCVNEIGHVQNWAEMLERDFLVLEETLRLVEEEEEEDDDNRNHNNNHNVEGPGTASRGTTWGLS